ncbi:hypothetical protein HNQ91_002613 [Filimonas zeae]|uniref:Uncharacterized protein n=1 Tax=Filimonas zeae TaxID=1737353 RepID=A0A917MVG2_9BACT|nr:hypothetical protein [Filimonas zeae]MDR6339562.1 hypothetical protein [Filimonas zeae]GGH63039.1 hypothetical protein GCM10011379_13490 [Filimonas zeae]
MKLNYRSAAIAFLVAIASVVFAGKANAAEVKDNAAVLEKQVSVKYEGNAENSVVFRVAFENPTAQKFTLIIKNDAGDVLYTGQFNDANFSKAVHLLKEASEMNPVFVIRSGNQKVEQAFKVSVNANLESEVVVSKQ